jgi:hypothetical protein
MARKKKAAKKKAAVKKAVKRRVVRRTVARVVVVRKVTGKRGTPSRVVAAKRVLREAAEQKLREGLWKRDQAKTRKQHLAAKKIIDKARAELRRIK